MPPTNQQETKQMATTTNISNTFKPVINQDGVICVTEEQFLCTVFGGTNISLGHCGFEHYICVQLDEMTQYKAGMGNNWTEAMENALSKTWQLIQQHPTRFGIWE